MGSIELFALAVGIVVGGLLLFVKAATATANFLERLAENLRKWTDRKEAELASKSLNTSIDQENNR